MIVQILYAEFRREIPLLYIRFLVFSLYTLIYMYIRILIIMDFLYSSSILASLHYFFLALSEGFLTCG
jgi:hypothetical protein